MGLVVDNITIEDILNVDNSGKLAGYRVMQMVQNATYFTSSTSFATIPINTVFPSLAELGGNFTTAEGYFAAVAYGNNGSVNFECALWDDAAAAIVTGSETGLGVGSTDQIMLSPEVTLTPGTRYRLAGRKDGGGPQVNFKAAFLIFRGA